MVTHIQKDLNKTKKNSKIENKQMTIHYNYINYGNIIYGTV